MDAFVYGSIIETDTLDEEKYGDEVMYAGWNPQLAQASKGPVARIDGHIDLPADLVDMDIETFLKRMYEYQC